MKLVSSLALAAAVAAGGVALQPALAAPKKDAAAPAAAAPAARKYNLSPEAKKPLTDLQNAVTKKDEAAYPAALAAAQAAAKNSDDRYILAKLTLQHAEQANDAPARIAAYQAVLASGGSDAAETQLINHNLSILAANSGNWTLAESVLTPILQANPNDIDSNINLARAKLELKKTGEALPLLQRAIQLTEATGKPAPEAWYRNALAIAYQTRNDAAVAQMNAALLKNYPSGDNFKNALAIFRSSGRMPTGADLDILRLIRASGVATRNDYVALANTADQLSLPGEVKSVLDEGRAKGVLTAADATQIYNANAGKIGADRGSLAADEAKARAGGTGRLALNIGNAYFGYGDYAKAADMYRIAAQRSDVEASLANLRAGEALALAGQRAAAETAFQSVTGPRAELAGLWRTWLAMPH
jgi:tetratricopeptide (TPR) repeat protein